MLMLFLQKLTHSTMKRNVAVSSLAQINPAEITYDFSSCFFPKFKIMHFQNRDIKLYTVVLLFLCFLKFLLKLCCR